MYPKPNVPVSELKVGDIVTFDMPNNGGTQVTEYTFMTVIAINGNEIAFARPFTRLESKYSSDKKLRPYEQMHEINGNLIYFGQEVFTAYRDHKGLFYTVWDSPLTEDEWWYTTGKYPHLQNVEAKIVNGF